jgi:siroheme synthase (precorrin-2 oxidase/ferrochelatase)
VLTVSRRGKGYTIEAKGDNPKLSQTIKRHLLTLIKQDTSNTTASQTDIAEAERILSTQLD